MNWYAIVLGMHIVGAIFIGTYIFLVSFKAFQGTLPNSKTAAKRLAYVSLIQIGTGFLVAILSPHVSWISFCSKMGLYVAVIGAVEYLLLRKAQNANSASQAAQSPVPDGT